MAFVFWDFSGILLIDYLENEKTINSDFDLLKKKCIYLKDNAPAHKLIKTMAKVNELRFELLPHLPYYLALATSDFHLFPNLKRWL